MGGRSEPGPEEAGRSTTGLIARIAVSVAALWLLAREADVAAIVELLATTRLGPLIAGFAIYIAGQVITAWRWQLIAWAVGFHRPLSAMVRYYFIGMFFAAFAPSTLGADVVRSLYLARADGRWIVALNTALFDRICGLAMLVALVLLAFACCGSFGLPATLVAATAGIGGAIALGWWALPALLRTFLPVDNRVRRLVEVDLGPFWNDHALLVKAATISFGFHVWQVCAAILVGTAVGLDVRWSYYFVFHPLAAILGALPISLGGIGVRELGYVWFLTNAASVPDEHAAAFAVLWLAVLLASSAVGGLVFLLGRDPLPSLRRVRVT